MEPFMLMTLIMVISGLLPDIGLWRTDNSLSRVSTATALVLGVNHYYLDPQPLYFLSELDKGSSQYDIYLAAFQNENIEHLEDVTVHYRSTPNETDIDDTPHDTNPTDTIHESPYSSTASIKGLWKLLPACKFLLAFIFGILLASISNDGKLVVLNRLLAKSKEELVVTNESLVISSFRKTYYSVTSLNRLAVICLLRLQVRILKRKLDEFTRRNAHFNVPVLPLQEELTKLKADLAEANKKLSTSSSTTDFEALISSLRAEINKVTDALAKAKEQQASTATANDYMHMSNRKEITDLKAALAKAKQTGSTAATDAKISALHTQVEWLNGELAKYTGKPYPSPSTNSAAATPSKFSADAAVFQPSNPSGPPSAASSPIPSIGNASRIPAPIGQSTTGPVGNKHNAPIGPNGKPVRHGTGPGGRSGRARDRNAANYFGPNTFLGSQPGPVDFSNYVNPFSFDGNGGSQPGDGSDYGSPGGFQGFGAQGQ